jgi:hypothetical protein
MKSAILIYSNFKRWILPTSAFYATLQISSIYLLNYNVGINIDRQFVSTLDAVSTFLIMFFLPFLTFKDKITKKLKGIEGSPWQFGIIVNSPIISLGAFISFIDLGLRMYWIPDNYWVDHWILYLALMMIATIFYIALSGFAGWLASAMYGIKKRLT